MTDRFPFASGQWIAYVGPFGFPEGSAAARRVMGICRSLAAAGESIVVAAGSGTPRDFVPLGTEGIDGRIWHGCLGELDGSWGRMRKARALLLDYGKESVRWLSGVQSRPKAVIVYGSFQPFLATVLAWCRGQSVPCAADIVEWYSSVQYPGGKLNPIYWMGENAMRRTLPRYDGVIGITSLLSEYYGRYCETTRVPPTLEVACSPGDARDGRTKVRLAYAGVPQRKDLLGNVLQGLAAYDPAGEHFEMTIVGPTLDAVRRLCPIVPAWVQATGRVSQKEAMKTVGEADFTVLLRPQERYANAGFPTKVAESMACGTPVVCNLTSDLGMYIRDGESGIVCADHSSESFAAAAQRIAALPRARLQEMRRKTLEVARSAFSYQSYTQPLKSFIDRIVAMAGKDRR